MMWRGAVFSSLLHGGLLIGLVGSLPILPRIFDRTLEAPSDELQISVDVVSAGALQQIAEGPGLRDTAPDAEAVAPAPKLAISRSEPNPSTQIEVTETKRAPESARLEPPPSVANVTPPVLKRPPESTRPEPPSSVANVTPPVVKRPPESTRPEPPSSVANVTPPVVKRTLPEQPRQNREPRTAESSQPTASVAVVVAPAAAPNPPETAPSKRTPPQVTERTSPPAKTSSPSTPSLPSSPRAEGNTRTGSASPATTSTDQVKPSQQGATTASSGSLESIFLNAVSGRKRDLIAEVLKGDPRIRRALTQKSDAADLPEKARARTLARLNKAAEAGFPHAQYNLAGKLLRGDIVARDMAAAQTWLTRAAEQGYAPAQSLLALMRLTGKGNNQDTEPDAAEAAFWWSLAAAADNPGAQVASNRLRALLRPKEHVRAQRLRARWGSLIVDLSDLKSGETTRRDLDRELQTAAEKGDLDAVLSLLARGADPDESGDAGRNAVINAAWRGRERIIRLLLERGVATELPDDDGRTPLIWAAINGHESVVSDLVASGANPNKRDRDGRTALIRAAWNGHTSVVSQLIAADADINARDANGLTALDHARRERNTAIIRLLEGGGGR